MDESPNTQQKTPVTLVEAAAQNVPAPTPPPVIPQGVQAPAPGKPTHTGNRTLMIIAATLALGILIFGFLYLRSTMQPKEEALAPVTPTTAPSPTPQPNLSRISTTSAFRSYSEEVASFSAILNAFTLQDATLVPPILDIELELKN